jgi:murein tripeptide amidase MpaA
MFDAGSIDVVNAEHPSRIDLNLRADSHADIHQWFHFRLQGARDQAVTMRFLNAGQATYPKGFEDYQAVASYDLDNWFRVPTTFDGQVMTIEHTPETDSIYYAYFEPYSWERHLRLLGEVAENPIARVVDLGSTVEGRDMNLVVIGNPQAEKKIWVIARQHPGESMAEWFVEGMMDALLDSANPVARTLLQRAVFYIVPNMNPDGSVRGNLRTNAAGANLNREWMNPSLERSPEVLCVKKRCRTTSWPAARCWPILRPSAQWSKPPSSTATSPAARTSRKSSATPPASTTTNCLRWRRSMSATTTNACP